MNEKRRKKAETLVSTLVEMLEESLDHVPEMCHLGPGPDEFIRIDTAANRFRSRAEHILRMVKE